jgi:RNA polymerase sigma factor (sigma-70 family)
MSKEREDALDNLADYTSLFKLKFLLSNLMKFHTMAESGNEVAHCISIDLTQALKSQKITNRQQQCLTMRYIDKETNTYIADQLNITESAVRKNLEGGLKRIRKILLGQC